MDNNTIKNVFKKYIHPLDTKVIQKMIDHAQVDKYVKKLDSLTFLKLFIFAQLQGIPDLGRISKKLKRKKKIQRLAGIKSISKSQLSRKLRNLPPEILQAIMHHLIQKLHQEFGAKKAGAALGNIHLIDSSTISMCMSQYLWADFRNTKAGVKMHTSITFSDGIVYPNDLILTPARPADITQLDALVVDKDAIHIFDRGYFDFDKFDRYCKEGIRFVTRIKSNTIIHVLEELPVDTQSTILRHAIVKIGDMEHPLQLITSVDSEGNEISIVCNDAKISAKEMSDLYRTRWQIELFFKWCKQHLVLKKLYGKSQRAVFNQIYIAMITFCLTLLMKKETGYQGTLFELFEWIADCWSDKFSVFLKALFKPPEHSSLGRRQSVDHEQVYKDLKAQYKSGDTTIFDEINFDLLF